MQGTTTTTCGKCNRQLKDPKSVERGYGPNCWAAVTGGITRAAGAAGQSKADYTYHISTSAGRPVLVIEDLDQGGRSVTNDIENVIADIAKQIGEKIFTMPVIYRDSEGRFDGVEAESIRGGMFYAIGHKNEADAVMAAVKRKEEHGA